MKTIIPATGNLKVKLVDCSTEGECHHTSTWSETIIAYLILTDEDMPEDAEGDFFVRPITTLDCMEHVQSYGGVHCLIVNQDGIDDSVMIESYS